VPLSSPHNPTIKYVRSLARASVRREEGAYLIEGVRLVTEALHSDQHAKLVLYDPAQLTRSTAGSLLVDRIDSWSDRALEVDDRVLRAAAQTETPAGIVAVLTHPACEPLSTHRNARFGLVLDKVADPGNAGTILRSATAFGAEYVITTPGTTDLFAPKVVRAGMGAHFRLPIYSHVALAEVRRSLDLTTLVAAAAGEGEPVPSFQWPRHTALVIGSEAEGLSPEIRGLIDFRVHIPMQPTVESLNAAVAASILLFAATQSRRDGDGERYR
jgi:TrmH family RNA methyltransferase